MDKRLRADYAAEQDELQARIRRMEGQVRGIGQMIADERYCLDILQQITALTAAANQVAIELLEAHLRACAAAAAQDQDAEAAIQEMVAVLRRALRP